MRKNSIIGCYGLMLACSIAGQAQTKTILTLKDCVDMALTNSTAVLKSNNNVSAAAVQVLAAYGQYLPNVVAAGGANYNYGNNFYASAGPELVYMSRGQYNYQLTSSLNIFTGYYNYSTWKTAKLGQQMATLTLDRAKQSVELDVTQSFLQVILDKKIVDLDSVNLQTSLKREDQLTMLNEVGRKPKTDLYQQQAQTSNDKLTYINAINKWQDDKILLFQKLRIDTADNYDLATTAIDDNADAGKYGNRAALVDEAIQVRADFKAAMLNTEFADWNIKKYKSGYLPTVSVSAGAYNNGAYFGALGINNVTESTDGQTALPTQLYKYTYGMAGLNATWNIFDKYFTKSNVAVARINADNARIDLQDTRIGIEANIKQAHNDYTGAVQQMETVDKGLLAAQEAFDAVSAQYREGRTDFITEVNAQLMLLQAQQSQIQASINMMLQKKIIDYYVGAN